MRSPFGQCVIAFLLTAAYYALVVIAATLSSSGVGWETATVLMFSPAVLLGMFGFLLLRRVERA